MNLEIERKFLLKRLPNEKPHDIIKMDQWYLNVNGIYERVRQRQWKSTGKIDWIHTIKEFVDEMSNIEIEKKQKTSFGKLILGDERNSPVISKTK